MSRYVWIYLLIIALGIFIACTSEKKAEVLSPTPALPSADSILYTSLNPCINLNSVVSLTPSQVPLGCEDIPTPDDSTATWKIDVDQDLISDLKFTSYHRQNNNFCSSHCVCYEYIVYLSAVNTNTEISSYELNPIANVTYDYDSTDIVQIDSSWNNAVYLQVHSSGAPFQTSFDDRYVGFRINANYGWIKIRPTNREGIKIVEYAINLTDSNDIYCGQTQ